VTAPRVVLEDPSLPHQIVIVGTGSYIAVSCTCLRRAYTCSGAPRLYLDQRNVLPAADAYACWLEHMAGIGEAVA
jgi:hypothetical protein